MKDLESIIRDNPNAVATIDNDYWSLDIPPPDGCSDIEWEKWRGDPKNKLATSRDSFNHSRNLGYVHGHLYGGDLLIVLAKMQGLTLEAV